MEILTLQFKTLSYCGVWNENTKFPFLKSVYKIAMLTLIFYFTITQIIEFLRTSDSIKDSVQVIFVCFTFTALCLKMLNFIFRQKEMLSLLKKFRSDVYQPNSPEEWCIFEKYTREINKIFVSILLLTISCGLAFWPLPLLNKEWKNFTLPYKSYQPYEITNNALYSGTYIFQIVAALCGVFINVSFDTMVYGFFLLICAQYEIFCHRLMKINEQNEIFSLNKYVDHHVFIQNLSSSTQSFFMQVVTPLFLFSLITLSTIIFKIVQINLFSVEFISMVLYLACMLFQIFLFCWHGNELSIKSTNVVNALYNSNWIKLDPIDRKGLKFMMQVAARERFISQHGQCCLNLHTFVWILKTSYSALNLLQQSANK